MMVGDDGDAAKQRVDTSHDPLSATRRSDDRALRDNNAASSVRLVLLVAPLTMAAALPKRMELDMHVVVYVSCVNMSSDLIHEWLQRDDALLDSVADEFTVETDVETDIEAIQFAASQAGGLGISDIRMTIDGEYVIGAELPDDDDFDENGELR